MPRATKVILSSSRAVISPCIKSDPAKICSELNFPVRVLSNSIKEPESILSYWKGEKKIRTNLPYPDGEILERQKNGVSRETRAQARGERTGCKGERAGVD